MKKCLIVLLSLLLFSSAFNFSFFVNLNEKGGDGAVFSGANVFAVQYELYKQTKNIVVNISDIIVNEISALSAQSRSDGLFLSQQSLFIGNSSANFFTAFKLFFTDNRQKNFYDGALSELKFVLLAFIFMFLIKYLGLLRVFWNIILSCTHKEAWEIRSLMLLLYFRRVYYEY